MKHALPLLLLALPAWAQPSPTLTFAACRSTVDPSALSEALEADGWAPLAPAAEDAFRTVMEDGMVIALNNATAAALDWPAAREQAAELPLTMLRAAGSGAPIRLFSAEGAALSVLAGEGDGRPLLHCLYAGPADAFFRETLALNESMDARAGTRSANEEYGSYIVQQRMPGAESGVVETDAQVSIYADPAASVAGRVPEAEMGFSSYSFGTAP